MSGGNRKLPAWNRTQTKDSVASGKAKITKPCKNRYWEPNCYRDDDLAGQFTKPGLSKYEYVPGSPRSDSDWARSNFGMDASVSEAMFNIPILGFCNNTDNSRDQPNELYPTPHVNPYTTAGSFWWPLGEDPAECPSGGCAYSTHTQTCRSNAWSGRGYTTTYANKVKWDPEYNVPCCLGHFEDKSRGDGIEDRASVTTTIQKPCNYGCYVHTSANGDAQYCLKAEDGKGNPVPCDEVDDGNTIIGERVCHCVGPKDYAMSLGDKNLYCSPDLTMDTCGVEIQETCSSIEDGVPLLGTPGHPCNEWYRSVTDSLEKGSGQLVVDSMVSKICASNPDLDCCRCHNDNMCKSDCIPYTMVNGVPTSVSVYRSGDDGSPVNLVDPRCAMSGGCLNNPGQILTSNDAKLLGSCPSLCMSVIQGGDIELTKDVLAKDGILIDVQDKQCKGASSNPKSTSARCVVNEAHFIPIAVYNGEGNWATPATVFVRNAALPISGGEDLRVEVSLKDAPDGTSVSYAQESASSPVLKVPPGQGEAIRVTLPRDSPARAGRTRTYTLELRDPDTGLKVGESLLNFMMFSSEFAPPPAVCTGDACKEVAPRTQKEVVPGWFAWTLLVVTGVLFALAVTRLGVSFFESSPSSPQSPVPIKTKSSGTPGVLSPDVRQAPQVPGYQAGPGGV